MGGLGWGACQGSLGVALAVDVTSAKGVGLGSGVGQTQDVKRKSRNVQV